MDCRNIAKSRNQRRAALPFGSSVRLSLSSLLSMRIRSSGSSCADTALAGPTKLKRCQLPVEVTGMSRWLPSANFTRSTCGTATPSRRTTTVLRYGKALCQSLAFGFAFFHFLRRSSTALSMALLPTSTCLPFHAM